MAKETLDSGMIMKALDWGYEQAVEGIPYLETAEEIGDDYKAGQGTLDDRARRLVRWQVVKAGTSGFIAGLGGIIRE
jgi:hypothetical protein